MSASSDTQPDASRAPVTEALALLERLITEAERAFAGQPKALWTERSYLGPKDAAMLRRLLP